MSFQFARRVVLFVCLLALPRMSTAQPPPPPAQPPATPTPAQPPTPPPPAQPPPTTTEQPATTTAEDEGIVFIGAGDIANCDPPLNGSGARATAAIIDRYPKATVFTTGDHAYQHGSADEFKKCYDSTWGKFKDRTRPAVGNHDLITANGKPYYDYFGEAAGPRNQGYYSYDLGGWHIIALNSAIDARRGGEQMRWLTDDLTKHKTDCVLAYWHIARYSSGAHGSDPLMADAWKILYDAGADVVLSSHDHDYERFAPMDDKGKPDEKGLRSFVVGMGGGGVYEFKKTAPNSEVRNNKAYGVLKLTLKPGKYDWEFLRGMGEMFRDTGSGTCSPAK
jgi:calcineurin-like phosphoesterase family protein